MKVVSVHINGKEVGEYTLLEDGGGITRLLKNEITGEVKEVYSIIIIDKE